jgi:hypothetical protein
LHLNLKGDSIAIAQIAFMTEEYWYVASTRTRNVLHIAADPRHAGEWALWLNDQLLGDRFGEPLEAAECASRKKFESERATGLLTFNVSADLSRWKTMDPDNPLSGGQPPTPAADEPASECKNRPWKKDGGSGRFTTN